MLCFPIHYAWQYAQCQVAQVEENDKLHGALAVSNYMITIWWSQKSSNVKAVPSICFGNAYTSVSQWFWYLWPWDSLVFPEKTRSLQYIWFCLGHWLVGLFLWCMTCRFLTLKHFYKSMLLHVYSTLMQMHNVNQDAMDFILRYNASIILGKELMDSVLECAYPWLLHVLECACQIVLV